MVSNVKTEVNACQEFSAITFVRARNRIAVLRALMLFHNVVISSILSNLSYDLLITIALLKVLRIWDH